MPKDDWEPSDGSDEGAEDGRETKTEAKPKAEPQPAAPAMDAEKITADAAARAKAEMEGARIRDGIRQNMEAFCKEHVDGWGNRTPGEKAGAFQEAMARLRKVEGIAEVGDDEFVAKQNEVFAAMYGVKPKDEQPTDAGLKGKVDAARSVGASPPGATAAKSSTAAAETAPGVVDPLSPRAIGLSEDKRWPSLEELGAQGAEEFSAFARGGESALPKASQPGRGSSTVVVY